MNDQHKIEQLEKALYILLEACDFEDVVEVGGEPLELAIENANEVLKYVEIDSESDEDALEFNDSQVAPTEKEWDDLIEETDYLEEDE